MSVKCFFGYHTGLNNSRYQFKAYNSVEEKNGGGSIIAYFHTSCGECGKELAEQGFNFGWYPTDIMLDSPHSLKECINKARSFQSNR